MNKLKKTSQMLNKFDQPTIWVITCLNMADFAKKSYKSSFGWYFTETEAVKAVVENYGDLHECYFDYAVVEEITNGIHGRPITEIWFKWDPPKGAMFGYGQENKSWWKNVDKPKGLEGVISFGIG